MSEQVSPELVADIAATVASEVVKAQGNNDTLLWLCFILISVLWAIVAYFVKRHIDNTDSRLDTHTSSHIELDGKVDKLELEMQQAATKKDISETYAWVDNKLTDLKENDIVPLRTELTSAINTLRLEIKQDLNTIITLIKGNQK